jgi:hypothetical protein
VCRLLFFSELSLVVVLATGIITTVVPFCTGLLAQLGSQAPSRQQLLDIETRLRSLQSKVSALYLNTSVEFLLSCFQPVVLFAIISGRTQSAAGSRVKLTCVLLACCRFG